MACELTSIQEAACSSGIARQVNQLNLYRLIAQTLANRVNEQTGNSVTVEAIMERACESGIAEAVNRIQLLQIWAQTICSQTFADSLVFTQVGGDETTIAPAVGNYNLSSTAPAITTVNVYNSNGITGLTLTNDPSLTAVNFFNSPNLVTINLDGDSGLTSIDLSDYSHMATIDLGNCTALSQIDLSNLVTVSTNFIITADPALTTISLPALTGISTDVGVTVNPSLTTFYAPLWVPTDGTILAFNGNALSAVSVNAILTQCLAAGVTTCTIVLTGGTNAAPSGAGAAAAAALTLAGNTVLTN